MTFNISYDDDGVTASVEPERRVSQLLRPRKPATIEELKKNNQALAFALAQVRALAEDLLVKVIVNDSSVKVPHPVLASLDEYSAQALNLPPLVDLTFSTDVEGSLGSPRFRLSYQWTKYGRRQEPNRVGALLETEDGLRRLPDWLLEAIEVSEAFQSQSDLAAHWEALARFRQALEPEEDPIDDSQSARVAMTEFLRRLEVRLADRFGVSPRTSENGLFDFDPVPFSGRSLEGLVEAEIQESHGELDGSTLAGFQERFRSRGALPAYRVGIRSYLVVDRTAQIGLAVMAEKQRASPQIRDAFVRNPRVAIGEATAAKMRENGELEGLTPEGEEEAIEACTFSVFTETIEFSERVVGTTIYQEPELFIHEPSDMTWLPDESGRDLIDALNEMDVASLERVICEVEQAVSEGKVKAIVDGLEIPASQSSIAALEKMRDMLKQVDEATDDEASDELTGAVILGTKENFVELEWQPELKPRSGRIVVEVPSGVTTSLKNHQKDGLRWQQACWSAGLPGVLNADEQGLGKTLQTIAFLRCLQDWQAQSIDQRMNQPMLIVAPTSLLLTWEAEVRRHLDERGLGKVVRLFGADLGGFKIPRATSVETESGDLKLDLSALIEGSSETVREPRWVLTTYTTLTNYHHSLARIPFAVAVFDEIQALKNPASLRSFAARSIQADFRIGLTGTPIENRICDLWAILDQLAPGSLGTLLQFNQVFSMSESSKMQQALQELYDHLFKPTNGLPPIALRRLKTQVAKELPPKRRRLHPRLMPTNQVAAYDAAKLKLGRGRGGFRTLHHIRSTSVHPDLIATDSSIDFVGSSGRMAATFDILRRIHAQKEKVLVFIEERLVQHLFIDIARQEFGLAQIDVINGSTTIPIRQEIVERFQRHITEDRGFDLLVLGTRAAGFGLTLTAATHVIHVSRWWNPAVEEQCNDRVHRIGQDRPVTIHVPMAVHPEYLENSFDCLLHSLMNRKRKLASAALWPMGETSSDAAMLYRGIQEETKNIARGDPVFAALSATFQRDGKTAPQFESDGSISYD